MRVAAGGLRCATGAPGVEERLLHGRVDQFDAHPEAGQAVIGERATVGAGVEIHRHTMPHQVSFGLGDVVDPVAQMIQSGTVRGVPRAALGALDELEIRWSLVEKVMR